MRYITPPKASGPYNKEEGPLITSTASIPSWETPNPWSPPHCWFSIRIPFNTVSTRTPCIPLTTGLLIPLPIEACCTPLIFAMASVIFVDWIEFSSFIARWSILNAFSPTLPPPGVDTTTSSNSIWTASSWISTKSDVLTSINFDW